MNTIHQIQQLLEENRNDRGIDYWESNTRCGTNLSSYGIGLTTMRKLAKQVGRDHELAQELWKSKIYDMKVMALLIEDPKKITVEGAEKRVEELKGGMFTHIFSACDAAVAKAPIAFDLACSWLKSKDTTRKTCGYNLIYELSKKKKVKGMTDEWLMDRISIILESIDNQPTAVRAAMGGALIGIGKRSQELNQAAIQAAKKIGPIDCYDDPKKNCDPLDLLKHLTSDYLKKKLYG